MKYMVPVVIMDNKQGKAHTVPFFADTMQRAYLLHDILAQLPQSSQASVPMCRQGNEALTVQQVLPPASIET